MMVQYNPLLWCDGCCLNGMKHDALSTFRGPLMLRMLRYDAEEEEEDDDDDDIIGDCDGDGAEAEAEADCC